MVAIGGTQKKSTDSNKNELFTVFYDILQQRTVHA